jgi:Rod binding domain-containing protein
MTDAPSSTGVPLSLVTPPPRRAQPEPSPEIRRVAEEFESVFLNEMIAPMFENIDTDGLGGGGEGERMFRPMLIEQYADAISKAGGVGIADSIIAELMRMQTTIQPQQETPDGADR